MAHFAQLDDTNVVLQVIVVSNETLDNLPFPESEAPGVEFCQSLLGQNTVWKQTSYSSSFRAHYAGIGYTYDASRDAFIPPQPFPSWTLNETTLDWDPPIPYPDDGGMYTWDEAAQTWVSV